MAKHAAMSGTPEERSERTKRGKAATSKERRIAAAKAGAAGLRASSTPEERAEWSRRSHVGRTPEQYSEIAAKRLAAEPVEKRRERLDRARTAAMALPPEKRAASRKKAVATRRANAAARANQIPLLP